VLLRIDGRSSCYDSLEDGLCSIEVEGLTKWGETVRTTVSLSRMLPAHRTIYSRGDILDPAFRLPARPRPVASAGNKAEEALTRID
jgi:hypothetical protein